MARTRSKNRGTGEFHKLPNRAGSGNHTGWPCLRNSIRLLPALDLCMWCGVYIGLQRGNDGGVVGVTVLDGAIRRRAWCHTDRELDGVAFELLAEYSGAPNAGKFIIAYEEGREASAPSWDQLINPEEEPEPVDWRPA